MGRMEGMSTRVLVVEDEQSLAKVVASYLERDGHEVACAFDGPSAVAAAREGDPDVVVLDLGLPGLDGIEVCRQIRTFTDCYVIMLTARDEEVDKLVGLGVGADDYVTKPFSPRELVARIRAVLRRADDATEAAVLRHDGLELDPATRQVRRDGTRVHLTPIEFDLLAHLLARPGVVFRREQLLADVWGYAVGAGPRTVDSHVRALRRKLGEDVVRTVHGVGYGLGVP